MTTNPRSSWKYQKARRRYLASNPLCVECRKNGYIMTAEEVDHVVPLHLGGDLWQSNWQGLCRECHREKSMRENPVYGEQSKRKRGLEWLKQLHPEVDLG